MNIGIAGLGKMGAAIGTLNRDALGLGLATAAMIFLLRWLRPAWPGMILAVAAASAAALALHLPVETIGARFGELPHGLEMPQLPRLSGEKLV